MVNTENMRITSSSITSLPMELVTEVLARVAASSSIDLFRAKQSCKMIFEASKDNYVYRRASLEEYPIVSWRENSGVSMFLNECRLNKNPEALYRKGVVDYFGGKDLELAFECLKEAAKSGHDEASYALGIIFLFNGGALKQKGITLLNSMKKSRIQKRRVKNYRENLRRILRMIWVKNALILNQRPKCCTMQHEKKKSGWPADEIDEDDNNFCEGCKCDEEIRPICDALPRVFV
ncbi:hypothetical protein ACH5RR_040549 [Cinchona calisaya]|uniref:At2g35280-like TPR domain-containing protein n=1 Tax=Cinchona calisaya TaxID=153742 RepID=A0ABD2XRZ6_9GENT